MPSQRSCDHSNLLLLFETTIESCRYEKSLEDDKKWREEKFGTPGNRSPEQQRACRFSVSATTKQPITPLRDVVVATTQSCRYDKELLRVKRQPKGKLRYVIDSPLSETLREIVVDRGFDEALDWLLEIMDVNVDGLLEGDSPQARGLLTYLEMYESGDLEILGIDGEGPAGQFYELGAGLLNSFGDFTELCDLSLRHLDKTIETGHKGRNRFRRPTLEEAQWEELEDDIMNIEDEVLRENVLGVFWGGCERQFMARVDLPLGAFSDGLSLIRFMLGAKGNGSFSDKVKYGAQISLSMGFFFLAFNEGAQEHFALKDSLMTARVVLGFLGAASRRRRRGELYWKALQALLKVYKKPSLLWEPKKRKAE